MDNNHQKVFVVLNPAAGNADHADAFRTALASHFMSPTWTSEIYETTGKEDLPAICREACQRGASLVIAAGGDGTVGEVGNGLVNSPVPLGVIPLGTGNDLARILKIPIESDKALDLLVGDHDVIEVDALKVKDRYFFLNVSAGFSPQMMKDTSSQQKKLLGRIAYIWTMIKQSRIFQLHRYILTIDGKPLRVRASEVMISNPTLLDEPPHLFGPPETLNDGQLEAYLVTAHTVREYLELVWETLRHPGQSVAKLRHWVAQKSIRIETDGKSQLVQADGEVIGHTPVEVEIVRKAIHVIMPRLKAAEGSD
jgi:diacylglycerol kinase (ATP)